MSKKQKNNNQRNSGQRQSQQTSSKKGRHPGGQQRSTLSEQAPVAIGNRTFTSKARFVSSGDKLTVFHSEYIGDITGDTSAFAVARTIVINPGIEQSFPWLYQIASRYESYLFRKLNFRFNTERPTTESGYISIVPDYDPTDPAPADKISAFQYEGVAKAAPWQNLLQISSPANLARRKSFFTRQGPLSATGDLGLHDSGNIFVCVGGNSGSVTLGQLWCDYEVVFSTPQIDSNSGLSESGRLAGGAGASPALPFGAGVSTFSRSVLWTFDSANGVLTFTRAYQGYLAFQFFGTGLVSMANVGTATATLVQELANAGGTILTSQYRVQAAMGQTVDFSLTGTTVTGAALRVAAYQYSLA